jgi:hypothetical protein
MFGTALQWKSLNVEIPASLKNVRFDRPRRLTEMKTWRMFPSNLVETFKLQNLASEFRHTGATDSKDKVYALLAIASNVDDICPQPDYNLSVKEVFTDVAKSIMRKSCNLDLLSECGSVSSVSGIPSWVPDWSIDRIGEATPFGNPRESQPPNKWLTTVCFDDEHQSLIAKGVIFDSISEISQPCRVKVLQDGIPSLVEIEKEWEELAMHIEDRYPNGEDRKFAFQNTMVGDLPDYVLRRVRTEESRRPTGNSQRGEGMQAIWQVQNRSLRGFG